MITLHATTSQQDFCVKPLPPWFPKMFCRWLTGCTSLEVCMSSTFLWTQGVEAWERGYWLRTQLVKYKCIAGSWAKHNDKAWWPTYM